MTEEVDAGDLPEEPQEQEPPAKAWSDDDEAEARAFGWKPSTEWQGAKPDGLIENPTEWMDRVKRSRTFTTMAERIERTERESAEASRRLQAMNEFALKAQREQLERRIAEISAQQRAAVADADTDRFDTLSRERADLEKAHIAPVPQQPTGPDPDVVAYQQVNAWAQNPLIFAEMAAAVDYGLKSGQRFASTKDQLAYAEKVVLQKYPHLAAKQEETPRPQRPGTVDSGGLAGGRRDGFTALPSEAKTAFERYVREGLYTNDDKGRRSFMEDYNAA